MSPHIIELLLFAGIAFFLISKLMSVLGTTTKEEQERFKNSVFGEPGGLKDVTAKPLEIKKIPTDIYDNIMVKENKTTILENLYIVTSRMQDFNLERFVKNSKMAFEMLIDAAKKHDQTTIEQLVDKRFANSFAEMSEKYDITRASELDAKVSEIYMFGNNVFVKVLFTMVGKLNEEWTFTKSIQQRNPEWFLSDITKA